MISPSEPEEQRKEPDALVVAVLKSVIPDAVWGVMRLSPDVVADAPPQARAALGGFENWSVFVFALPITEQSLWIWHKHGDRRSLFANYILELALRDIRDALDRSGIASVDFNRATGGRLSLVEFGERAGLGTRGVNNLLLHPVHGAWLQLNAIFIDHPLLPSSPLTDQVCIRCMNCVEACPPRAVADGDFDAGRCARVVASFWNPRSRAIALSANSYLECAECISSCPIGANPAGILQWKHGLR